MDERTLYHALAGRLADGAVGDAGPRRLKRYPLGGGPRYLATMFLPVIGSLGGGVWCLMTPNTQQCSLPFGLHTA